jgi:hypothetical protein
MMENLQLQGFLTLQRANWPAFRANLQMDQTQTQPTGLNILMIKAA